MILDAEKLLRDLNFGSLDFSLLGEEENSEEEQKKKREEWLLDRRGKFTASEIHKLTTFQGDPKKGNQLPPGGITYARAVAIECITVPDCTPSFQSKAMAHGNEHEGGAARRFSKDTGIEVCHIAPQQKFLKKGEHFGCTPDGLIYDEEILTTIVGGVETKCPNTATHLTYLKIKNAEDLKQICAEYYWQIMFSMWITGATHWYFISYDPRMLNESRQIHWVRIERDEAEINFLRQRTALAIQIKNQLIAENT